MHQVTAVMYHYVRDVQTGPFRGLKALSRKEFIDQLDWIGRNYHVISVDDFATAWPDLDQFPANSCLLTFDDGLRDHYDFVCAELVKRDWSGAFYASADSVLLPIVLDVHKIHLLLSEVHVSRLMLLILEKVRASDEALADELMFNHYRSDEYDCAATVMVKRCLNFAVRGPLRRQIINELFATYISADEASVAHELYFNVAEAKEMVNAGMCFGGHGKRHAHMPTTSEKAEEIVGAVHLLTQLGLKPLHYVYPFLSYDAETLRLLTQHGFKVGFSSGSRRINVSDPSLLLPRFDTIELPPISRRLSICSEPPGIA